MSPARPHIALVSQVWTGHIPAYHRSYARALTRQGVEVVEVIFQDEPATTSGIRRRIAAKARRLAELFPGVRGSAALQPWRRVAEALARIEGERGIRVDGVLFVYLDLHFLNSHVSSSAIERILAYRWAGIVVHPLAAYGVRTIFPGGEKALRALNCRAVAVIDRRLVEPATATWPQRKVVLVPDLADTTPPDLARPVVREIEAWTAGRQVVGLLGAISAKKNVAGFLALARAAQAAGDDTCFVIAGLLSEKTAVAPDLRRHRAMLADLPSNCRAWTGGIEEGAEFNAVVTLCDVIFIAYLPAPENSNILTKAAWFRKPVLASAGHWMADPVRTFQLGEIIDPNDAEAALAALRQVFAEGASKRRFGQYYAQHGEQLLTRGVAELTAALVS